MCIMEVRPGQRASTIAQAMAHNTSTVERDLDMFEKLLKARGEEELLRSVERAHQHLRAAYADFLEVYGEELVDEVAAGHNADEHVHAIDGRDHVHNDVVGNERIPEGTLVAQAHHDAGLARRFETR